MRKYIDNFRNDLNYRNTQWLKKADQKPPHESYGYQVTVEKLHNRDLGKEIFPDDNNFEKFKKACSGEIPNLPADLKRRVIKDLLGPDQWDTEEMITAEQTIFDSHLKTPEELFAFFLYFQNCEFDEGKIDPYRSAMTPEARYQAEGKTLFWNHQNVPRDVTMRTYLLWNLCFYLKFIKINYWPPTYFLVAIIYSQIYDDEEDEHIPSLAKVLRTRLGIFLRDDRIGKKGRTIKRETFKENNF